MSPYPSGSHQGVSIHTVALQEPCQSKSGFHQKCIHPYCDPTIRLSIPTRAQPETYPSLSGSYQWRIHPNGGPTRSCTHAHRDPTRAVSIPGGPRQWRRQPHRGFNRGVPIPMRILLRVQSYRGPTKLASTHADIIQGAGLAAWGPTRGLYIHTWGHASGASMLDVVRAGARRSGMRWSGAPFWQKCTGPRAVGSPRAQGRREWMRAREQRGGGGENRRRALR